MSCVVAAAALGFIAVMVFVGGKAWYWLVLRWGAALWVWAGLAGLAWVAAVGAWSRWLEAPAALPAAVGLIYAIPAFVAALLTLASGVGLWRTWRERRAVREAFPTREGAGRVGSARLAGDTLAVQLAYELRRVWFRWDGRAPVLRCRVAPETVSRGGSGWQGLVPAALLRRPSPPDGGLGGRVWLHDVTFEPGSGVRVLEGVVEVRPDGWLTEASVAGALEVMGGVTEALRRSAVAAPARFAAIATGSSDPAARRQAWLDLEALASARTSGDELRTIAPLGLSDPDPVIRAVAAWAVGDTPTLEGLLRTSDAAPAVLRATRWALWEGRQDLAPVLAARLGTPPEEAWPELVTALGTLGGRAEMEALHAVREGEGFPKKLRSAADEAMLAIRNRIGPVETGALTLAEPAGGEVSVAAEAGAVAIIEARRGQ